VRPPRCPDSEGIDAVRRRRGLIALSGAATAALLVLSPVTTSAAAQRLVPPPGGGVYHAAYPEFRGSEDQVRTACRRGIARRAFTGTAALGQLLGRSNPRSDVDWESVV